MAAMIRFLSAQAGGGDVVMVMVDDGCRGRTVMKCGETRRGEGAGRYTSDSLIWASLAALPNERGCNVRAGESRVA